MSLLAIVFAFIILGSILIATTPIVNAYFDKKSLVNKAIEMISYKKGVPKKSVRVVDVFATLNIVATVVRHDNHTVEDVTIRVDSFGECHILE